eukprot:TRINITY_DN18830_c0_g1_i1.p2 TRINITY_DN18830_c0_g1~~TRINITY_DN18830_c0_g1_i1.p2  ORF type:complete len:383 (-),score=94.25 TRINITY_DN18830_c0_g1_i1:1868-3016(-)
MHWTARHQDRVLFSTMYELGGDGDVHFTLGRRQSHVPPVVEYAARRMSPETVIHVKCPLRLAQPRRNVEELDGVGLCDIVEVELEMRSFHECYNVTVEGGVTRRIMEEGFGLDSPNPGTNVVVGVRWYHQELDEAGSFLRWEGIPSMDCWKEPVTLSLVKDNIVEGLEEALFKMKNGEHCLLEFSGDYVSSVIMDHKLDLKSTRLIAEVYLHSFDRNNHQWELEQEEKYEFALLRKEQGNTYFSRSMYHRAIVRWEQALEFVQYETTWPVEEIKVKYQELRVACHNNIANVYQGLKDYKQVVEHCNEALEIDPANVKALLRRCKAYVALQYADEVLGDVQRLLLLTLAEDQLKTVRNCTTSANQMLVRAKQKEKEMFGGVFK